MPRRPVWDDVPRDPITGLFRSRDGGDGGWGRIVTIVVVAIVCLIIGRLTGCFF